MDGNYLYNKVLPLVDYCGNIRSNSSEYSQTYSPNNIRRLYLSPDGASVRYHIQTKAGLTKSVSFTPDMVVGVQMCEDYKPMLGVLYADRICASIEEVVVCAKSSNSNATLDARELDFKGLVKSYKGDMSDIKTAISGRYKRLVAFILYTGTLSDFLRNTQDYNKSTSLLVDCQWVRKNCKIEGFTYNDWYKRYGYSAKFYAMDRQGSPLNNHFLSVIEKKEKEIEDLKEKSLKEQAISGVKSDFELQFEKANKLIRAYTMFRGIEAKYGMIDLFEVEVCKEKFLVLNSCSLIPDKVKNLVKVEESKLGDKEAIKQNIEICKQYSMEFYSELVKCLLENLNNAYVDYPAATAIFLKECDRSIMIPPNLESLNSSLPYTFSGKRWDTSIVNIFYIMSNLFSNAIIDITKERWQSCIQN